MDVEEQPQAQRAQGIDAVRFVQAVDKVREELQSLDEAQKHNSVLLLLQSRHPRELSALLERDASGSGADEWKSVAELAPLARTSAAERELRRAVLTGKLARGAQVPGEVVNWAVHVVSKGLHARCMAVLDAEDARDRAACLLRAVPGVVALVQGLQSSEADLLYEYIKALAPQ